MDHVIGVFAIKSEKNFVCTSICLGFSGASSFDGQNFLCI